MKKLLVSLLLLLVGFGAGLYVGYNKMTDLLLTNLDSVLDTSMNTVTSSLQDVLDAGRTSADQSVDAFIQEQKQKAKDAINAEKEKLKEQIKADIKDYLTSKVNTIFGSETSPSTPQE